MTASITFYDTFREYVADGTFDLNADTFKLQLCTSTYSASTSHSLLADVSSEVAQAGGYSTGGKVMANVTWGHTGATATFDADDTIWTVSATVVARTGVVYKSGTANGRANPLVCYVTMDTTPADVTTNPGNTLTFQWNASGIFTLT